MERMNTSRVRSGRARDNCLRNLGNKVRRAVLVCVIFSGINPFVKRQSQKIQTPNE